MLGGVLDYINHVKCKSQTVGVILQLVYFKKQKRFRLMQAWL